MRRLLILIFTFTLIFFTASYGLSFDLPKNGGGLVGQVKTTQVKEGEDFSDIAERFDVGYYEIFESNPGVDPDHPEAGTVLVVPTQYILPLELRPNTIVINLAEMRLYYQPLNLSKVYIFPVGIGKEDWGTPLGESNVIRKAINPTWIVPESIYKFRESIGDKISRTIPPGPDNPLGKRAIYLSQQGNLIHGTNLPAGVGRRSSAGCIRLYEKDVEQLYDMVEVGTRVIIINKPYKAGWLDKKLYLEAHMPLFEQRLEMGGDMKLALDAVTQAIKGRKISVDWSLVNKIAKEHLTVPRPVN